MVDVVLPDPIRERDRVDAEFEGGLLGLFASAHKRDSTSTKLRRRGAWHVNEPSGSGHQLASETGTISVGQVKMSPTRAAVPSVGQVKLSPTRAAVPSVGQVKLSPPVASDPGAGQGVTRAVSIPLALFVTPEAKSS